MMSTTDWVYDVDKFVVTYGKGVVGELGKVPHKTVIARSV